MIRRNRIIESINARKNWRLLERKVGAAKLNEEVKDIIFEETFKVVRDGAIRGNHTYSSKNIDTSFPAEKLREFNKEKMKKLKESLSAEDKVIDGKEEIKYVFTFGSQDKEIEEETQEMKEEKYGNYNHQWK